MYLIFKRIQQVVKYGWQHSRTLANKKKSRLYILVDMLYCFFTYKMWTNQYVKEKFYLKNKELRKSVGEKYYKAGKERDAWQKDFVDNRRFLNKYSSKKYELPHLRKKRNKAYQKRYEMGKNCFVEYGVELTRQHYLAGTIQIGENVLFAKNVFIDYSGGLCIGNDVQITDSVKILTHGHVFHNNPHIDMELEDVENNYASFLKIEDKVVIGSNSIILEKCHYIGIGSRIGAGSVVTKDVPDYSLVAGVPAKIIRYNLTQEKKDKV